MIKQVCVIGMGYIGLPTAALLAHSGYSVHGVDVVEETVNIINQGLIHIVEPDLSDFVKKAVEDGSLKASLTPKEADVFIIAVPTPFHDGYVPNIDYVISATEAIAPFLRKGNIIILESTSPIGTTELVGQTLEKYGIDLSEIYVSYCPERVLPGQIMKELISNDRIVGGLTKEATLKTAQFYKTFVAGDVLQTDAKTAEMAKLTENSFRDVNIAFANELSILCDKFDINVWELIKLANRHPRVNILNPGAGVGGHCIAVDPWFIVHAGQGDARIIKTAREVNNYKTEWVIEKIINTALQFEINNHKKPKIACLGLAFKPNIDDLRESPAVHIVKVLKNKNMQLNVVEPNIKFHKEFEIVSLDDALAQSDIVVILVAHNEFKDISIENALDFCGALNK